MTNQTIYAVSYARVSTDDHDQNPESQLLRIRKWASERNITILREFSDKATGTNDERDGLDMIFGFKRHHPELSKVIILDADRLSRNMDDAPKIIEDFNKLGMQIVYVADESIDVTTKEGKLMNAMKSYGAQAYTDGHRLKIMAGLDRARAEGKHIGRPLKREESIDIDVLMGLVQKGYSLRKLEKVFKVSRTTLTRRIKDAGRYEEYQSLIALQNTKNEETEQIA